MHVGRWLSRCIVAGVVLLTVAGTRAAAAGTDPILTYFDGGSMRLNLGLSSQLLTGAGVSGVAVGAVAPSDADPFTVLRNPSGMRYIRNDPMFGMTFNPQLLVSFNSLPFPVQDGVNSAVDGFTENFQKTEDFNYPKFGGSFARSASALSSFAFALPVDRWRFGFGYSTPFHLSLDMFLGGFRQRIDTVTDKPEEQVAFAIQTKIGNRLTVDTDRWSLAVSRDFFRHFTLGASISRTIIAVNLNGGYNVDGIMTQGTQQYYFNNADDPWYNNLHSQALGGYSGSLWTMRLGAQIASVDDRGWRLGAELVMNTQANLAGALDMTVDEFPALKLQTKSGEDPFDVNRIADVSEITRTYPNHYLSAQRLRVQVPSSYSVAVSRGSGLRPNLNFTQYFGGRFSYDLRVQEKRVDAATYNPHNYGRGLILDYQAYLGIHPGWFFMGVGAVSGKDYVSGYKDGSGEPIVGGNALLIPRFDLGFTFHLNTRLHGEVLLTGLPEDALRLGLTYEF